MLEINTFSKTKPLFEYLRRKKEDQRFVRSIEIGCTFLFISFFLIFAIKPTAFTISALMGEIRSKEELSKQMKSKINQIVQAQDAFAKIQINYRVIESCLPERPKYYQSAIQHQLVANLNSIQLDTVNFKQNASSPGLSSYNLDSTSYSRYPDIASFVKRISQNRRLMDFDKLSLFVDDDKNINFAFSSKVYYWQQNKNE